MSSHETFPPVVVLPRGRTFQPWSGLTRLLPFIEQAAAYDTINWNRDHEFTTMPTLSKVRVSIYMCPSEVNDTARVTPVVTYYPSNYNFNQGTWFVYDPPSDRVGDGAFVPNRAYGPPSFTDGLSNTIGMSEGKAYQPNFWDTGNPAAVGVVPPTTVQDLNAYVGGTFDRNGHTEWVEGDVHETGFTTVFTPNFRVLVNVSGQPEDVDLTSMREGESFTLPTYAAVTARSYHPVGVTTMMLDGSVRFIKDTIDRQVWRGLATRAGKEVISADAY